MTISSKPRKPHRPKEVIAAEKAAKEKQREIKRQKRQIREEQKLLKQNVQGDGCNTEIGWSDPNYLHDVSDKSKMIDTRRGPVCPNCMNVFKRTNNGVSFYNSTYAEVGCEISLDEDLAENFKKEKAQRKVENERREIYSRKSKRSIT